MAAGLDPAPANLADWAALRDQSPLDFYRRVNIGVVGTAMPAFEDRLPARDRWAVALYASTLRLPPASGDAPAGACRASPPPARCPTPSCSTRSARRRTGPAAGWRGWRRCAPTRASLRRRRGARARCGPGWIRPTPWREPEDPGAGTMALNAYMTFEQVEREVREARTPASPPSWRRRSPALRAAAIQGAGPRLDAGHAQA